MRFGTASLAALVRLVPKSRQGLGDDADFASGGHKRGSYGPAAKSGAPRERTPSSDVPLIRCRLYGVPYLMTREEWLTRSTADFRVGPQKGSAAAESRNATCREDKKQDLGVGLSPSVPTSRDRGEQA